MVTLLSVTVTNILGPQDGDNLFQDEQRGSTVLEIQDREDS